MRVAVILFAGAEELDFAGPIEVLGAARKLGADLELSIHALPSVETVSGVHGLTITKLRPLEGVYDLVVIPGGGWAAGRPDGVRGAIADGAVGRFAQEQHAQGAVIAAVCTGSLILAAAGMLKDRSAATHHTSFEDLKKFEGVNAVKARVVDTGDIISTGGVTSGIDLCLWLVERFFGADLARQTEDYLEYTRQGEVLRT